VLNSQPSSAKNLGLQLPAKQFAAPNWNCQIHELIISLTKLPKSHRDHFKILSYHGFKENILHESVSVIKVL
jgi:hypothetical protein